MKKKIIFTLLDGTIVNCEYDKDYFTEYERILMKEMLVHDEVCIDEDGTIRVRLMVEHPIAKSKEIIRVVDRLTGAYTPKNGEGLKFTRTAKKLRNIGFPLVGLKGYGIKIADNSKEINDYIEANKRILIKYMSHGLWTLKQLANATQQQLSMDFDLEHEVSMIGS